MTYSYNEGLQAYADNLTDTLANAIACVHCKTMTAESIGDRVAKEFTDVFDRVKGNRRSDSPMRHEDSKALLGAVLSRCLEILEEEDNEE